MLKCCLKIGSAASSPSSSLSKQLFKLFFKPIILILTSAETRLTGVTHTSVHIPFYVLVMLCSAVLSFLVVIIVIITIITNWLLCLKMRALEQGLLCLCESKLYSTLWLLISTNLFYSVVQTLGRPHPLLVTLPPPLLLPPGI